MREAGELAAAQLAVAAQAPAMAPWEAVKRALVSQGAVVLGAAHEEEARRAEATREVGQAAAASQEALQSGLGLVLS